MNCSGVKITDLDSLDALTGLEYLMVALSSGNYKVPINQLLALFSGSNNNQAGDTELYNKLLAQINAFKGDISDSFNEFKDTITSQIKSLTGAVNGQIQGFLSQYATDYAAMTEKFSELSESFEQFKRDINDLVAELASNTGGDTPTNSTIQALIKQFNELSALVSSAVGYINDFNSTSVGKFNSIDTSLEALQAGLDAEIADRKSEIKRIEGVIESTKQALETKIQGVDDKVTALTGRVDTVETTLNEHVANKENPHTVTKLQVGLGNADDTADTAKPVSTLQQTAIDEVKTLITEHTERTDNPHKVTKEQVEAQV